MTKDASAFAGMSPDETELELIRRFARAELTASELYIFPVALCDNRIDRDFERFTAKTLSELAELFVGRTGIFDHQWSAAGQKARIYRTEIVSDSSQSAVEGEPFCFLKAWAYMLREGNESLIREIEAGIKKEVSVGCAVRRRVCSICGEELGSCPHVKGQSYGGALCHGLLLDAADAYEWSFVAVPAQRGAGVVRKGTSLKALLEGSPDCAPLLPEYQELLRLAQQGERYMRSEREAVLKLGLAAQPELDADILSRVLEKLDEGELAAFKRAFSRRLDQLFPVTVQLRREAHAADDGGGEEFMI